MKALILALILMLVETITVSLPAPVQAMAEPVSVKLYNIQIFNSLVYTNDFLAIVPYKIPFTLQPADSIDKTFLFQIISPDGLTINGISLAYPRYTGGYGTGIVSFYFPASMTWGAAYIFRVQENPAYYPSPLYWDFTIGSSQYSTDTDQVEALRAKIIDSATELTAAWGLTALGYDLLATSDAGETTLSTLGQLYYINAVPGLQTFCPALFPVQIKSPTYTKRTWATTLADSMETKYAGTPIDDFMTGYAGLFSMQKSSAMTFLSIILFILLMLLSVWKFKASMLAAFIDGYALLLLLMLYGSFSMIYAGLMAFLSVFMGGVVLFLNK
jgi:hypothetical protein